MVLLSLSLTLGLLKADDQPLMIFTWSRYSVSVTTGKGPDANSSSIKIKLRSGKQVRVFKVIHEIALIDEIHHVKSQNSFEVLAISGRNFWRIKCIGTGRPAVVSHPWTSDARVVAVGNGTAIIRELSAMSRGADYYCFNALSGRWESLKALRR